MLGRTPCVPPAGEMQYRAAAGAGRGDCDRRGVGRAVGGPPLRPPRQAQRVPPG